MDPGDGNEARRHGFTPPGGSGAGAFRAGAAAGLAGGVLMASWATVYAAGSGAGFLFPLRIVGEALGGERALVGGPTGPLTAIVAHLVLSSVFGVVFAAAIGKFTRPSTAVPAGILYGVLLYFVMIAGVLPWVNPDVAAQARLVPSSWLLGHVLFGFGVSIAPALRRGTWRVPAGAAAPLPSSRTPAAWSPWLRVHWARLANMALGLWLIASTIAFRTESSSGFNTLVAGLLVTTFAASALFASPLRFANTFVGVWLLYTGAVFGHASVFRTWNSLLVAGAVIVLSLVRTPLRIHRSGATT